MNNNRELSYREICEIMGVGNLRKIPSKDPERPPEQEQQLELFADGEGKEA